MSSQRQFMAKAVRRALMVPRAAIKAIVKRKRPPSMNVQQPMSVAQTLPPELLLSIFKTLHRDKKSLAACTTVCRSWSPLASELLLRHLALIHFAMSKPPDLFSPFARAVLRNAPNRLSIHMASLYIALNVVDFSLLCQTLACLTKLEFLYLNCGTFQKLKPTYRPPTATMEIQHVGLSSYSDGKRARKGVRYSVTNTLVLFRKIRHLQVSQRYSSAGKPQLLQLLKDQRISVEELKIVPSQPLDCVDPTGVKQLELDCERFSDQKLLNFTISKFGANVRTLQILIYHSIFDDHDPTAETCPPLSIADCTPALQTVLLDVECTFPDAIMLDSWRMCLEEFSHPHVEDLCIRIRLRYGPFIRGEDTATTQELLQGLLALLPWQMLDTAVSRCPNLKSIQLVLEVHAYCHRRESLHTPMQINTVPEIIVRHLSRSALSMLYFHALLEDRSRKQSIDL